MDLHALLTGSTPPSAGTEVRRIKIWPTVLVTLFLVAFGIWAYDYVLSGQMRSMRGKTALGLIAWPFIVAWWAWNTVRALRWKKRGWFGWALSDTHFGYVSAAGSPVGPFPLAAIRGIELHKPRGAGAIVYMTIGGTVQGQPASIRFNFQHLTDDELGLLALRPSGSKALFRALAARLRAVNPAAEIIDATL